MQFVGDIKTPTGLIGIGKTIIWFGGWNNCVFAGYAQFFNFENLGLEIL